MGIHGLYVAHLTPEELDWFDAECKAGRAHRRYNWAGLSKVDLSPPPPRSEKYLEVELRSRNS